MKGFLLFMSLCVGDAEDRRCYDMTPPETGHYSTQLQCETAMWDQLHAWMEAHPGLVIKHEELLCARQGPPWHSQEYSPKQ